MLDKFRITALIPARGGSKRLPRKNIRELGGKPLISWSIETALSSEFIDNVIVSTDDVRIKEVSELYGASVPFLRPACLSNDNASSFDVVEHAINFLQINKPNELIVLLQPTSPLRTVEELNRSLEFFIEKRAKGVVSISETEHSPMWANTLPPSFNMANFIRVDMQGKRSQDLPKFYRLNGSIYIYQTLPLLNYGKLFFNEDVFGFQTSPETSVDIDTVFDFQIAEIFLQHRTNICSGPPE